MKWSWLAVPFLVFLMAAAPSVDPKAVGALSSEVLSLYTAGKKAEALAKAEAGWAKGLHREDVSYNAACLSALLGKKDEAFVWLDRSVEDGLHDTDQVSKDPDLVSLHADPRFAGLKKKMDARYEQTLAAEHPKDANLQHRILALVKEDQAARQAGVASRMKDKAALAAIAEVDQRSTAFMKKVVAKHGWPGNALVGPTAAKGAWLLVQHADKDPAFQENCLGMMEKAVKAHQADGKSFAYLTDRVRLAKGEKQLYGTQFRPEHGQWVPRPIEDAAHVDARRKAVGLGTMAEYLEQAKRMYGPAPADPPAHR
jgi:hypothetical protein